MTLLSRILLIFPFLHFASIMTSIYFLIIKQNLFSFLFLIFFTYLFPILIFRIHFIFFKIDKELWKFSENNYNPWWGGHQIQGLFIAYPGLETLLRLIPGVYSFWLRLWGAHVGKNVYWTPAVEILDRNLIEIGNNVVFGHLVKIASHVVTPRKNRMYLFTKKVIIEDNCFIGAATVIGPGTTISAGQITKAGTDYFNNSFFKREQEPIL